MRFSQPKRKRGWRRSGLIIAAGAMVLLLIGLGTVNACAPGAHAPAAETPSAASPPQARTAGTATVAPSSTATAPLVFTYFFYWYDATTGGHLGKDDPLPTRPIPNPAASWRSDAWWRKELSDMHEAGIDVALLVYWGTDEEWSTKGLTVLADVKSSMAAKGEPAPQIGLFYDTASLKLRDLTTSAGQDAFYSEIREFYRRIPAEQWARVDGRPVIWLFIADPVDAFDQSTFDHVYAGFERDFGVRPYIVRELSWDYAISGGRGAGRRRDTSRPISTDATYVWARAQQGYNEIGAVAGDGPGYDERQIKGRSKVYRPRDGGRWYTDNFRKAIDSGKRMLVIETWNELHEASGIGETVEFGRQYIELTRTLVDEYKRRLTPP